MIMKTIAIALLLALTSCRDWRVQYEPANDAERSAAAEHVQKVMQYFPKSAGGDDQDYDDALRAAHREAAHLFCTPILCERDFSGMETGNRKPMPKHTP